jgi:hypothetical protein
MHYCCSGTANSKICAKVQLFLYFQQFLKKSEKKNYTFQNFQPLQSVFFVEEKSKIVYEGLNAQRITYMNYTNIEVFNLTATNARNSITEGSHANTSSANINDDGHGKVAIGGNIELRACYSMGMKILNTELNHNI